jgi:hypothetical protein
VQVGLRQVGPVEIALASRVVLKQLAAGHADLRPRARYVTIGAGGTRTTAL